MSKLAQQYRDVKLKVNYLLSKKYSHRCLHPDCRNKAIGSHSISKSTLQLVAKNSHVIMPIFNRAKTGRDNELFDGERFNLDFKPIGIDDRNVKFNGFCQHHDTSVFEDIDKRGIVTQRDVLLQFYRTAKRYYFLNNAIKKSEQEIYGFEYDYNSEYEHNKLINNEKIISLIDELLSDVPSTNEEIKTKNSLFLTLFSEKFPFRIKILYKRVSFKIPLCLQSQVFLSMNDLHHTSLFLVIPSKKSTSIMVLCHPSIINQYSPFFSSDINLLNLVESMLMQDSEFFLDPNIFDSWGEERKKLIIEDYYFLHERSFLEEYDISLFDKIRKKICIKLTEKERIHELKKIYELPNRTSRAERNHELLIDSIQSRHKKLDATGNKDGNCLPKGGIKFV